MPPNQPPGPFESEAEVLALPAVQAVYEAFSQDPGVGKMAPHNQQMLLDALAQAGVNLGAYDHRIVKWLATWEPQTVAVIAGWVQRARQADDQADARADARMRDGPQAAIPAGDHRQRTTATLRPEVSTEAILRRDTGKSLAPREEPP